MKIYQGCFAALLTFERFIKEVLAEKEIYVSVIGMGRRG